MATVEALTCVCCPKGCDIDVTLEGRGNIVNIEGNLCEKGHNYAIEELGDPARILTAAVNVPGALEPLSVRTENAIPRRMLFDAMKQLQSVHIALPVHIGDVICDNICGTGVAVVATKELHA